MTEPAHVKESLTEIVLGSCHKKSRMGANGRQGEWIEERDKCVPDERGACILISTVYSVVKECCILQTALAGMWNNGRG